MAKRKLNELQLQAIALLAQPQRGGMTYEEIAKKVGVSRQTLYEWRNMDEFNEELKKQVLRNSVEYLPDMYAAVPRHVIEEGNAALFRTFLQSLGMLTEKVEVNTPDEKVDIDSIKAEIERLRRRERKDD